MADSRTDQRRKLEAALSSARTTVALLEAELAETDVERWATPDDNPLGNAWTFRRLCREGAFPCVLGPRKQKRAKWRDVVAYAESQNYVPPAPKTNGTPDEVDPFESMIASGELQVRQ